MKVLLVEPMYGYREALSWIPIGKAYMATQLIRAGFEVRIIDNALHKMDQDRLGRAIAEYSPDIVGTGGMSLQWGDTKRIAAQARERLGEGVLLVGGGVHLTALPEEGGMFDLVVEGEGEITFLEVCQRFRETRSRSGADYADIAGICYRNRLGMPTHTPLREFVEDMDLLGMPAYDLLDVPLYHDHLVTGERAISIMTGRGCPFECTYCGSPFFTKRKMRYHSLDHSFRQMEMLRERYGFSNFRIMDDTFAARKKRVFEFCAEVHRRGMKANFNCLTHVNTADPEMFREMARAGFSVVALGIESANDRVLQTINKRITKERAARACKMARDAGLIVEGLFMVGNSGDTRESIEETLRFALEHNPTSVDGKRTGFNWFQFATPFPGSKFYHDAAEHGTVLSHDFDDFTHQVPVFVPHGLDYKTLIDLRDRGNRGLPPERVEVGDLSWDG